MSIDSSLNFTPLYITPDPLLMFLAQLSVAYMDDKYKPMARVSSKAKAPSEGRLYPPSMRRL